MAEIGPNEQELRERYPDAKLHVHFTDTTATTVTEGDFRGMTPEIYYGQVLNTLDALAALEHVGDPHA